MANGSERVRRGLAWALVLAAVVYLAWWGILRGLAASGDLAVGYAAGSAWLQGLDPYDVTVLEDELTRAGADATTINQLDRLLNVYFPTTLPSFVPLAPLSWPVAKVAFVAINTVLAVFIAWGAVRWLAWRRSETRTLLLVAFILALAPTHTTIAIGQGAILATSAIVAAALLERSGHRRWAGVAYGLAIVAKVQIGLPFLAYVIWRRRWETVGAAAIVAAGFTVVAVGRMALASVPWLTSWTANLRALSGPGGINDPSAANPERYSLINLQYLLQTFGISGLVADLMTYAIVGLAALALVSLVRGRRPEHELLVLSGVAVLGLLVTYHRYYDAVLLALPIAWGFSLLGARRAVGAAALVACANFLFPFQTAFHELAQRGIVPAGLVASPIWDTVIATQHVWALLALVAILLWAARRGSLGPLRPEVAEPAAG